MTAHDEELGRVLLTDRQIADRVRQLGAEITRDYQGRDLVIVGVLKGAAAFTVDLARAVDLPVAMDWVAVSTYGRGSTPGTPRLLKDVGEDLAGRDVLVVEDILDTGTTLSWLMARLRERSPASVNCCVLLRKPHALTEPVEPRYAGFDIAEHWVAGYGIDYAERHRNLGGIHEVLLPSAASPASS
ncbi:hypoxanthine phosphoribosyltransferase [Streptomyces sp. NPDC006622]|uniref:hypoxanthine phosphoribosyltransferase n=1 Tax=Streptomyces sp. NPDC006622 TaxID=3155459 RepID=UPI0033A6E5EA